MNTTTPRVSPLRQRMIEDMRIRKLALKTQSGYIRAVRHFTIWFGRSPDQAGPEDLRLFQLHLVDQGPQCGDPQPRTGTHSSRGAGAGSTGGRPRPGGRRRHSAARPGAATSAAPNTGRVWALSALAATARLARRANTSSTIRMPAARPCNVGRTDSPCTVPPRSVARRRGAWRGSAPWRLYAGRHQLAVFSSSS